MNTQTGQIIPPEVMQEMMKRFGVVYESRGQV